MDVDKNNFDSREGTFIHTFRFNNTHIVTLGDTYLDQEVAYVNLVPHETLSGIIDTVVHEDLHVCLKREEFNDDTEHEIIRRVLQVQSDMWF